MEKQPAVCILAGRRNGTLYAGVTSDLPGRIWQHKEHLAGGFTDRFGIEHLAWYELARNDGVRHRPRGTDREMASRMENRVD